MRTPRTLLSLPNVLLTLIVAWAGFSTGTPQAWGAKCPNVHVVLDRSGSMSSTVAGRTRWDIAKEAVNAVLDKYDGKFPIGLSIFPNTGCDAELVTEPKYKSKMTISTGMNRTGPSDSTPSASAMQATLALKSLREPDREQYVILITDGGPGCGAIDTCAGTVMQLESGVKATPTVYTFVVGFGGGLSSSESQCLSQMAVAGGKPAATAEKYYKADNAADLNTALSEIVKVIGGGGDVGTGGFCDDTCYSNGCKTPGDICVSGECTSNPCAGVVCPKDQYCYTDGKSPAMCTRACTKACPRGTRCLMGSCANDPCPSSCPAGTVCDSTVKHCVRDPLCGMMAADEQCKGTSACRAGKCVDDPCRFLTCPKGTRCLSWEGTCDWIPPPPDDMPMDDMPMGDDGPISRRTGCSTIPGGATGASAGAGALYLLGLLVARRRRRAA